jgi:hypothetical protein
MSTDRHMPPRNPQPALQQASTPKKRSAGYVLEIRDAAGVSLVLTRAEWTDTERDMAISAVLRLAGMKAPAPAKRQGNKPRSGDQ